MSGRIEYYLIPIKKITCNQPRSEYPEQRINDLAQKILATGVLLEPLVVVRSGSQSYSLLDGALNYHAAAKARELSPRDAEMVSAFVVESADLTATEEQLKILKSQVTPPPLPVNPDPPPPDPVVPVDNHQEIADTSHSRPDSESLLSIIQNQAKQLSQLVSAFEASSQRQDERFSQLVSIIEASVQSQDKRLSQLASIIEASVQSQDKRLSQLASTFELAFKALSDSKSESEPQSLAAKVAPQSSSLSTEAKKAVVQFKKLKRDELIQIAQQYGLKVPQKATKAEIIELLIQNSILSS